MSSSEKAAGWTSRILGFSLLADLFGADRYRHLKIRIFVVVGAIAGVPLLLVVAIGYFWFESILREDLHSQMRWQMENARQAVELFVEERIAAYTFIAASHGYGELSDPPRLRRSSEIWSAPSEASPTSASSTCRGCKGPTPVPTT